MISSLKIDNLKTFSMFLGLHANPVHCIRQQFFSLSVKKPSLDLIFFSYAIPSSSKNEKHCQMLSRLFVAFLLSKNILWVLMLPFFSYKYNKLLAYKNLKFSKNQKFFFFYFCVLIWLIFRMELLIKDLCGYAAAVHRAPTP